MDKLPTARPQNEREGRQHKTPAASAWPPGLSSGWCSCVHDEMRVDMNWDKTEKLHLVSRL
jgi:hypothetical protein